MRRLAVCLIQFYRRFLSPLKGKSTCRFYPTCSLYAIRVYRDFGLIGGTCLTVWRLLRCQPFCRGGIDLPPPYIKQPDKKRKENFLPQTSRMRYESLCASEIRARTSSE
ncbi:MAG: membrane protein insertion efficiency factor YidD [Clostridia bacterium]|nr:membrane protein insertion efficiency factor YidD [Clostridia bacterium]